MNLLNQTKLIRKSLIGLSLLSSPLAAVTLAFDFEDGTTQGWTNITTPTTGTTFYGAEPTDITFTITGDFGLGPQVFGDRDAASDGVLLIRSEEFAFDSSMTLSISFALTGGTAGSLAPTNETAITSFGASVNGDGATFQGVALRRESDGEYLLTGGRTINDNALETVSFTDADIQAAIAGDTAGETYTLDLIDTQSGGWGWVGLDDVVIEGVAIPEPTSVALLALGGLAFAARRKR